MRQQMKWWSVVWLVFGILAFVGGRSEAAGNQLIVTEISAPSIKNNMIEEQNSQKIAVILPASYGEGTKRYPVLYFLPGYGDTVEDFDSTMKDSLNKVEKSGKNGDMIIVIPQGSNRLAGAFYANSPVTGNWEDYIVKDVVGYVDSHYRTVKKREGRGLAGHSMGGSGAMNIGLHRPDVFSYIYAMSPGLFEPAGLEKTNLCIHGIGEYGAMTPEEARAAYMKDIENLKWPEIFTYAYGSAFSPDPDGKAPYIAFVPAGADADDSVWKNWDRGFGDMEGKINQYLKNGIRLQGITIDYGKSDQFTWIPQGCEYVSALLASRQIPHQLIPYEGKHGDKVAERIQEFLIPYFGEKWNSK